MEQGNGSGSENGLVVRKKLSLAPEVKWVSEDAFKNMKIVVEIDSDIDAQRTSEEELRRHHKSLSVLRIVTDRGLQIGDVAILDISASTIEQDGSSAQRIPPAETTGFNFDTEDGDKVLPGFLDSIIGIQRGETKSFPLVFPESWNQENLRGVHAQFTGPLQKVCHGGEETQEFQAAECEGCARSFLYNSVSKDSILITAWSGGQLQVDALADAIQPLWASWPICQLFPTAVSRLKDGIQFPTTRDSL